MGRSGTRPLAAFAFAVIGVACIGKPVGGSPPDKEAGMETSSGRLAVELALPDSRIRHSDELRIRAVLTNGSDQEVQLNGLFLSFTTIVIEVRRADGSRVDPGPPPLPPSDDGETGRFSLAPGESEELIYYGSDYFGSPLPLGHYTVHFSYENIVDEFGDWTGTLEAEPVAFDVVVDEDDEEAGRAPPVA